MSRGLIMQCTHPSSRFWITYGHYDFLSAVAAVQLNKDVKQNRKMYNRTFLVLTNMVLSPRLAKKPVREEGGSFLRRVIILTAGAAKSCEGRGRKCGCETVTHR